MSGNLNDNLSLSRRTYYGLDIFKLIMAIFVVAIHTFPWESFTDNFIVSRCLSDLTKIAVPFFFMASGFLLAGKFTEPYFSRENEKTVLVRAKQMLVMYLKWTAVYFPLAIYDYIRNDYSVVYSVLITIRKIVFRGENFNSWMLWYLLSTVYALIFVYILMKIKIKPNYLIIFSVLAMCVSSFVSELAWNEGFMPEVNIIRKIIFYTITDGRIFGGFVYIPLGIFLLYNARLIKGLKLLPIPCFVGGLFIKSGIANTVLTVLLYIGVFAFAADMKLKPKPVYKIMRHTSTTVYFIHMYVFTLISLVIYHHMEYNISNFIFTVLLTLVFSLAYAIINQKRALKKRTLNSP